MQDSPATHLLSQKGIFLEHLLTDETRARLRQKQVLYVVQAKLDEPDQIVKFGRGGFGQSDKNGAFNRLRSYVTSYGLHKANPDTCSGVKIYFLAYGGRKFIRDLEESLRKELNLEQRVRRGRERVYATTGSICRRIRNIVGTKSAHLSILTPFRTDAESREKLVDPAAGPTRFLYRAIRPPRRLRF